jgi:hypothetical protein
VTGDFGSPLCHPAFDSQNISENLFRLLDLLFDNQDYADAITSRGGDSSTPFLSINRQVVMNAQDLPASIRKYHAMISDVSDERSNGDGYWVYLKSGFCYERETHAIHEDTLKECAECLRFVEPCSCSDCEFDRFEQKAAQ